VTPAGIDSDIQQSFRRLEAGFEERLRRLEAKVEAGVKESITKTMVDLASVYWPPPPAAYHPSSLRPASSVMIHGSRVAALRRFLRNDRARFRCPEQGELIEKMQARRQHVLAILACDFGKTTMIMLQAKTFDSNLITVVVLPLSGLHSDFHRRAAEHGVPIWQWNPEGNVNDAVSII
jgi:superfamily II DNA helicase RecQ